MNWAVRSVRFSRSLELFEALERRTLLSAVLHDDGILRIAGTARNDRIRVWYDAREGGQIVAQVNGAVTAVPAAGVSSLRIEARAGNDSIHLDEKAGKLPSARIYGDAGNDTIISGSGHDRIFAGEGDDEVTGGNGRDTIYGEGGHDYLRGNGGNDLLDGGDGHDTLRGEGGSDKLNGGAGKDLLFGGNGNDRLVGGDGEDLLRGGAGDDRLFGHNDTDVFYGDEETDAGYGDNYPDTLYGDDGDDYLDGGPFHANSVYGGRGVDTFEFMGDAEDFEWGVDLYVMGSWPGYGIGDGGSGEINIDDYGLINFNTGLGGINFGYFNGDFNYDWLLNNDDYGIIDFSGNHPFTAPN